jgi:hypothetical protein
MGVCGERWGECSGWGFGRGVCLNGEFSIPRHQGIISSFHPFGIFHKRIAHSIKTIAI